MVRIGDAVFRRAAPGCGAGVLNAAAALNALDAWIDRAPRASRTGRRRVAAGPATPALTNSIVRRHDDGSSRHQISRPPRARSGLTPSLARRQDPCSSPASTPIRRSRTSWPASPGCSRPSRPTTPQKVDPLFVAIRTAWPTASPAITTMASCSSVQTRGRRDPLVRPRCASTSAFWRRRRARAARRRRRCGAIVSDATDPGPGHLHARLLCRPRRERRGCSSWRPWCCRFCRKRAMPTAPAAAAARCGPSSSPASCAAWRRRTSTAQKPQQLRRRINECLNNIQDVGVDSSVPIAHRAARPRQDHGVPDSGAANVRAMGPMICAAMFDELKAFDVVDTIVYLWQQGIAADRRRRAGKMLYRLLEGTRRTGCRRPSAADFYAMTMGIPGGGVNGNGRSTATSTTCGCVSSRRCPRWSARRRSTSCFAQSVPVGHSASSRCARPARDLASNLSRHGYGIVNYAAIDLQDQINKMIELLDHDDIKRRVRRARHVAGDRPGGDARAGRRAQQRPLPDAGHLRRHHHRLAGEQRREVQLGRRPRPVIDLAMVTSADPRCSRDEGRRRARPTTTSSTPASCGWPIPRCRTSQVDESAPAARNAGDDVTADPDSVDRARAARAGGCRHRALGARHADVTAIAQTRRVDHGNNHWPRRSPRDCISAAARLRNRRSVGHARRAAAADVRAAGGRSALRARTR